MSKNAEGWIRHRGGKCPVEDGVLVDVRFRDKEVTTFTEASSFFWEHGDYLEASDIMAYRLHKPAEQVEACSKPELQINLPDGYGEIYRAQAVERGPLQWRDRINEIDVEVQARTVERTELVQKLASEGFALIGRINDLLTDAAQKHEDMSDWRNWKVGDEVVYTSDMYENLYTTGKSYKVKSVDTSTVSVFDDLGGNSACCFDDSDVNKLRWVSRPSA